ncbi:MAG TPA: hypothetical protein VFF06_10230 [Polyangia bacterium]|nr:hypothetical protein [Polyangia bacterium]
MTTRALDRRALACAALVVALYAACAAIARSAAARAQPGALGMAITIDLTVTATFLVWLAGVRPGVIARRWLPRVFALGLVATRVLLLPEQRELVGWMRAVWVPAELALVVLAWRARRFAGGFAAALGLGWLFELIASELTVVRYAFAGGRAPAGGRTFTYHRRAQWRGLAAVFGFLILVETGAMHLVIARWSPAAAWIATALGVYSIVWLVGDWRALAAHPLALDGTTLRADIGLRWRVTIPLALVEDVTSPSGDERADPDYLNLGPDRAPSLVVRLRAPIEARGLFGRKRLARRLGLPADAPSELAAALESSRSPSV